MIVCVRIIVKFLALSTEMEAPLMLHKLVVTSRMRVHRNAVHRTSLQGPQSCSAKTHDAYNRRHNAYNRAGTLHQAAFLSVCTPSSRCRCVRVGLRVHASVCACVRGCQLGCVRARVRVCVCTFACKRTHEHTSVRECEKRCHTRTHMRERTCKAKIQEKKRRETKKAGACVHEPQEGL